MSSPSLPPPTHSITTHTQPQPHTYTHTALRLGTKLFSTESQSVPPSSGHSLLCPPLPGGPRSGRTLGNVRWDTRAFNTVFNPRGVHMVPAGLSPQNAAGWLLQRCDFKCARIFGEEAPGNRNHPSSGTAQLPLTITKEKNSKHRQGGERCRPMTGGDPNSGSMVVCLKNRTIRGTGQ